MYLYITWHCFIARSHIKTNRLFQKIKKAKYNSSFIHLFFVLALDDHLITDLDLGVKQ